MEIKNNDKNNDKENNKRNTVNKPEKKYYVTHVFLNKYPIEEAIRRIVDLYNNEK